MRGDHRTFHVEGWHKLTYSRWIAEGLLNARTVFYCPSEQVEVVKINSEGWTILHRGEALPVLFTTSRKAIDIVNARREFHHGR